MPNILIVGNATLDIVNTVEHYPPEDAEVRALGQSRRRGGNAANTAVVLARLGHRVSFAGTVADEPDGRFVLDDLRAGGVDTGPVRLLPGKAPTSYVTVSRANGSRTIVHVRDLPEYTAGAFAALDLSAYDWLHFEGRNVEALGPMLSRVRRQSRPPRCSLEAEKLRPGLVSLFPQVDLLLFARAYALAAGVGDAAAFLAGPDVQALACDRVCAWGATGAWAVTGDGTPIRVPAYPPAQVVDTLGAGDVFNAGVIDGLARGRSLMGAVDHAARLAGRKCGMEGLAGF